MRTKVGTLHILFFKALTLLCVIAPGALAKIYLDADKIDSISHFRAFPPSLQSQQEVPFIGHSKQDSQGYIWMSGGTTLLQYDGYELTPKTIDTFGAQGDYDVPFLYLDNKGELWVSSYRLHRYDVKTEDFISYDVTNNKFTRAIEDDGEGNLWLAGREMGVILLDKETQHVVKSFGFTGSADDIEDIQSIAYNQKTKKLWMSTSNGIYYYDNKLNSLHKIITPIDQHFHNFALRDASLDISRSAFWVGTPMGLLRVDTQNNSVKHYTQVHESKNQAGLNLDVTTTYLDSANNLWVGLEKMGMCLYRNKYDNFICMESSVGDKQKIPFVTIEDITEDDSGSLWLSVNNYGVLRVSPDLEKIKRLRDVAKNTLPNYFLHTHDGLVLDNGDIWFATDGGGINIYNYKTGILRNIKHDPNNKNSLPSDSVLDLALDEHGNIWAGFWSAGISKINPKTMTFTNYKSSVDRTVGNSLAGNNVFIVKPDMKGGIWIGVWHTGLQYFRPEEHTFETYDYADDDKTSGIENGEVLQATFFDEQMWIVGSAGLEIFDFKTKQFKRLLKGNEFNITSIVIDDIENIFLGTRHGLVKYNHLTGETTRYQKKDGLSHDEIFYLSNDSLNNLWIATNNGVSIFDKNLKTFQRLFKKDGLASNKLSTLGNFFEVNNQLFITGKSGVNIIDPSDIPNYGFKPKTVIRSVQNLSNSKTNNENSIQELKNVANLKIPFEKNNMKFQVASLSYVFPNRNLFKYRLIGWQDEFTEVDSTGRTISFNNLKPGKYVFEAISSNGDGIWSESSVTFPFKILTPWYATWWALLLYLSFVGFIIYILTQFRLAVNIKRERELSQKITEKTSQLEENALELRTISASLAQLNSDLEQRVEQRTEELQIEINERKVAESKLFHMAFHDVLTGLPNRQWLIQRLQSAIEICQKDPDHNISLMFLDGDRFKQINDTHGHSIGDELLISAGIRLASVLSEGQHAARLGGDEFTVFIENAQSPEHMEALAEKIIHAFSKPFIVENYTILFNVSIGIVVCDSQYNIVSSILRDADIAMYRAKEAGKANYKVFDAQMRTVTLALAQLEEDLHLAVKEEQFHLVYQPILDLKTDKIIGFEALIRWVHPTKGFIPPIDFIPISEENGLIWEIGSWVLDQACEQMKKWHAMDIIDKPVISVNLSTCQLRNDRFLNVVDETLSKHNVDANFLKLELTESMLIENNETISTLIQELQARNIDLAIDDFGTGYSSLAYLNEIPVQYIKIDKKFIDAIDCTADGCVNDDALEIVKATISLGKSLRKLVIAEGIETDKQLAALREFGCDFAQGYYIDKPLKSEDAEKLLLTPRNTKTEKPIDIKRNPLSKYQYQKKNRSTRLRDSFKE